MLRRTTFKPKNPDRATESEDDRAARKQAAARATMASAVPRASVVGGATSGIAVQKHVYIRSPALLAAVRTLPCMHTGRPGPNDPAHSNWAEWGQKAKGVKADDNRVAALCREVHQMIDQGSKLSRNERREIWWNAHVKTVRELLSRGLWPADCPIPDIRRMN